MATSFPTSRPLAPSCLPPALRQRAAADPTFALTVRGNADLLANRLIGFFCSQSSPGDAILNTYDLALALRDSDLTFIGGFQSPMEKEFLTFVLRGTAPVIICPARGITPMRLPAPWKAPLEDGSLLLLSCFNDKVRRPSQQTVATRNALVADLAACLLVPHAAPGGKVEHLCEHAIAEGKPVLTVSPTTHRVAQLGARRICTENLPKMLANLR